LADALETRHACGVWASRHASYLPRHANASRRYAATSTSGTLMLHLYTQLVCGLVIAPNFIAFVRLENK